MKTGRRHRSGVTLLLVIGLIVVVAGACAVALYASLDTYRVAVMAERRAQANAAADGALVLLDADPAAKIPPTILGRCSVEFQDYVSEKSSRDFLVRVQTKNGRELQVFHYRANYETAEDKLKLRKLEMIP